MHVRDGMSGVVLVVGPGHTLREAARLMAERHVGAAVVMDPDNLAPGILTERDIVRGLGESHDPDSARVADHMSTDIVYASPEWSMEEAAVTMVRRGFRHLVVVDGGELAGVLSMRDIVRVWTDDGSSCELPASVAADASPEGDSRRGLRSVDGTSRQVASRGT
jgi:CBS domain-containing protein